MIRTGSIYIEETRNGYLLTCISRDDKLVKFVAVSIEDTLNIVGDFLRKQWEYGILNDWDEGER